MTLTYALYGFEGMAQRHTQPRRAVCVCKHRAVDHDMKPGPGGENVGSWNEGNTVWRCELCRCANYRLTKDINV